MPDGAVVTTSKVSVLRAHLALGTPVGDLAALRMAYRFPRLPATHRRRITRGWEAHTHPRFWQGLGLDPATLLADGVAAVREVFLAPPAPGDV